MALVALAIDMYIMVTEAMICLKHNSADQNTCFTFGASSQGMSCNVIVHFNDFALEFRFGPEFIYPS